MSPKNDPGSIVTDPEWLPSHWDRAAGALQFAWVARAQHAGLTFLADEYLRNAHPPTATVALPELRRAIPPSASAPHYIFHSAFCCSTLLARALDVPGAAMALKEPQILNELAAAARAEILPPDVLVTVERLLARPFGTGERVIIKPSNTVNLLAIPLMERVSGSRALFLYAPLERFLRSIAGKGMWGRIWARRLFTVLRGDTSVDFGLSDSEQFELTDLQLSALAWLMQHEQGAALAARFPDRVRTLDSETFLANRAETLHAVARHFGLAVTQEQARAIAQGPVFAMHSKAIGREFDPEQPLEPRAPVPVIEDEIAMVTAWARTVAEHVGLRIDLPASAALTPGG